MGFNMGDLEILENLPGILSAVLNQAEKSLAPDKRKEAKQHMKAVLTEE